MSLDFHARGLRPMHRDLVKLGCRKVRGEKQLKVLNIVDEASRYQTCIPLFPALMPGKLGWPIEGTGNDGPGFLCE